MVLVSSLYLVRMIKMCVLTNLQVFLFGMCVLVALLYYCIDIDIDLEGNSLLSISLTILKV